MVKRIIEAEQLLIATGRNQSESLNLHAAGAEAGSVVKLPIILTSHQKTDLNTSCF